MGRLVLAETLWECRRGRRLRATSLGQFPSTDEGGRRRARLSPAQSGITQLEHRLFRAISVDHDEVFVVHEHPVHH